MLKSKGLKMIEELRTIFETRPHQRDATLTYLTEVYRTVRKNRWIRDEVDLELEREPRTSNLFAHLIEVTSDLTQKLRSKYANVLRIAHEQNIQSTKFRVFIENQGGFNKVIEKGLAKRRKFALIGEWR
jgi:hypothetical protein